MFLLYYVTAHNTQCDQWFHFAVSATTARKAINVVKRHHHHDDTWKFTSRALCTTEDFVIVKLKDIK